MYAIIDKRASIEVKNNLAKYADDVFEFSSENITYDSISGHPDIFLFQENNKLIVAPNSPKPFVDFLDNKRVKYSMGKCAVGDTFANSVLYNCLSTEQYFFCKKGAPDVSVQEWCAAKQIIHLPQPYTRCSMFNVENKMITSDKGIVKELEKYGMDYFYFDPKQISIKEHKNGFIGGTMGSNCDQVFFLGNLSKHNDGKEFHKYITKLNKEVICLGNDYLYDGGGLFFVS